MQNSTAVNDAAQLQAGESALLEGKLGVAEGHFRRVLSRDPNQAEALMLLGFVQLSQGRYTEALPVFDQLCRMQPGEPSHWVNLGNAYRGTQSYDDALTAFGRAMVLGEDSPELFYNLGLTHAGRGDSEAARVVFGDALRLTPEDAETRYRYVLACYDCLRTDLVLEALAGWEPAPDTAAEVRVGIGQVLMNVGEYPRAERLLRQAAAESGHAPKVLLMLMQVLERTNRVDEAQALLQQLNANPDSAALGSELQRAAGRLAARQSRHELAVELYRQALVEYQHAHDRHHVLFALAQSLHALGRYDEAMEMLIDAHRSQAADIRLSKPMTAVRGTPHMQVTQYRCDPADVATWNHANAPSTADSPVFVVAFPRSGTTLLELTLDAHPLLRSMDEQPFLQNVLEDIVAEGVVYPEQIGRLTDAQLDKIRANYWQRVGRKLTLEPGQRLVDKNPLNILRLPAIRRVFPNSPILLAIRHPCDVILSCYMQHFRAPDFALMCADLPSLTTGYRRTFDFWYDESALLQPKTLEVRYESFVADIGSEVRRIVEFLELPWDEAMLKPADRAHAKGFISTPSYSQVVQPVNQKAVGKWQAYRKYLEPALPIVEPYLQRWNYGS